MKKYILLIFACIYAIHLSAQNAGINFLHGTTWAEAVAKAKAENKLIFIDFYTQWCGPCHEYGTNRILIAYSGGFTLTIRTKLSSKRAPQKNMMTEGKGGGWEGKITNKLAQKEITVYGVRMDRVHTRTTT